PSHIVRATLLADALGPRWTTATPRIKLLAEVDIPRAAGALQIESVHVVESHRGRRIAATLIEDALAEEHPALAQILSLIENDASARAFEAAGFHEARRRGSESPELRALLPGSGRVLWERHA